jgi:urocanate hydratase
MRHTDAGYEEAIQTAKEKGIKIPGVTIYDLKEGDI